MNKIFYVVVAVICGCAQLQNVGQKLRIDKTSVNPPNVSSGATVTAEVEYSISSFWFPQGGPVVEIRNIQCDGEAIKLSQKTVNGVPGKNISTFKFAMPSDVGTKKCNLTTTLSIESTTATASDIISVRK